MVGNRQESTGLTEHGRDVESACRSSV